MRLKFVFCLIALLGVLAGAAEAQEKGAKRREIRVEKGLLSVAVDRVPAGEVFRSISEKAGILVRLDEALLKVPLTEEFEKLPMEEGLRKLVGQLRTENFLMAYVPGPGGERRVVGVEVLLRGGQGVVREFGSGAGSAQASASGEGERKIPKGIKMQMERGLNPGQLKRYERTGKLPRNVTHIPEGLLLKKERGEALPLGAEWRMERALKMESSEASPSPAAPKAPTE